MLSIAALVLQIAVFNLAFSLGIFLAFKKLFRIQDKDFVFVLGLGPALTSLLLYFLLLFFPHLPPTFYLPTLLVLISGLLIYPGKMPGELWSGLKKRCCKLAKNRANTGIVIFYVFLLVLWIGIVIFLPVLSHDTFEYGIMGKIIYNARSIVYRKFPFDFQTHFYYVGKHGLTYPLFGTLERMVNSVMGINSDLYFRSISGYYWLLILAAQYILLSKLNRLFALVANLLLISTFSFALMFGFYHIDTYRIFFMSSTLFFVLRLIQTNNLFDLVMFGIFGGLMANSHSIGAILIGVYVLAYLLFQKESRIAVRITRTITVCMLILLFGAIHYPLDIFLGTGWLL